MVGQPWQLCLYRRFSVQSLSKIWKHQEHFRSQLGNMVVSVPICSSYLWLNLRKHVDYYDRYFGQIF